MACGLLLSVTAQARNRVIAYGWDVLRSSTEDFLANAEAWDEVPVDGVVFTLNAPNPAGGMFMHRRIPTDKGWTYAAFAPQVPEAISSAARVTLDSPVSSKTTTETRMI